MDIPEEISMDWLLHELGVIVGSTVLRTDEITTDLKSDESLNRIQEVLRLEETECVRFSKILDTALENDPLTTYEFRAILCEGMLADNEEGLLEEVAARLHMTLEGESFALKVIEPEPTFLSKFGF